MRIKLGQIGIGHNHAEGKMLADEIIKNTGGI